MRGRHARFRDPRRSLQPSLLATGVLAVLATTGGVITVVGWTGGSTSETFSVHAARIPRMARPTVRPHARPRIAWQPVAIADGVPVQRYVVTRHLGAVTQIACDVVATAEPRCADDFAPPGYRATYTVAARHGAHWTGVESAPSLAITTPGTAVPISVDGMMTTPGPDGAPVIVSPDPQASAGSGPGGGVPASAGDGTEPSSEPSRPVDVVVHPPVVIPPAPAIRESHAPARDGDEAGGAEAATEPSDTSVTESATVPAGGSKPVQGPDPESEAGAD